MAQSKRTFNQAKLERDLDDRIVPQGTYRDALNISIDTSEDANVGVIENMKGNELIANQDILGLSSSSNPNAKVIGSYAHPEENKIYYFVTGDNIDGIFEYDITNNAINTLLLDSTKPIIAKKTTFTFAMAGVTGSISQNGIINVLSGKGTAISITQRFLANTSGSAISVKIPVKVRVPRGYANYKTSGAYVTGSITANQPSLTAPTPTTAAATNVSLTTATLNGELDNDDVNVTSQGFFFGYKSASNEALTVSELTNGGSGIVRSTVTSTGVNNDFNKDITGIPNEKLVSFVATATNSVGQGVATNVLTFTTSAAPTSSVIRPIANKLYMVPSISDATTNDQAQIGYGPLIKSNNKAYFNIFNTTSDGLHSSQTIHGGSTANNSLITISNTGPATLTFTDISFANTKHASFEADLAGKASGLYTITVSRSGFTSNSTQILVSSTSTSTFTSKFTPTFAKTGTGTVPYLAEGHNGLFEYNVPSDGQRIAATTDPFIIGPLASGNKGSIIIPFANTGNAPTSGIGFTSFTSFDASKLDVSIPGKTVGVDYDFFVFDTAPAVYGTNPGILIECDPNALNAGTASVTHTVNITYNY